MSLDSGYRARAYVKALHNLQAWGLTAVSLLAGIVAGAWTGDWTWFARSGSAVVAIGIVLTSRQIFDHNRRLLEYQRRRQHRRQPDLQDVGSRDWADENSIRALIRARTDQEEAWRREFSGFYMLVGGTLVWGFGDLVGRLFN